MSDIIEKLGIKYTPWKERLSGHPNFTHAVVSSDGGSVCHMTQWGEDKTNQRLIAAAPEMLEHLFKIVKSQNDENATLANLNGTINNAKSFLLEKYPEIKELLNE